MRWDRELRYIQSKLQIKSITNDFINIKCPICGEGKSKHKSRGYILKKDDHTPATYYCHNEPEECSGSFGKLLQSIGVSSEPYYREFKKETFKKLIKKDTPKYTVTEDDETVTAFLNTSSATTESRFRPCSIPPPKTVSLSFGERELITVYHSLPESRLASAYLNERRIPYNIYREWFFIPKIEHILIPFKDPQGFWYGYQTRSIHDKAFHIELVDQSNHKFWDLQRLESSLDKNVRIFIFESVFNAASVNIESALAALGTRIPEEILEHLPKDRTIIVFDNDEAGLKAMNKLNQKGFRIFIYPDWWEKEKDFNDYVREGKLDHLEDLADFIYNNSVPGRDQKNQFLNRLKSIRS